MQRGWCVSGTTEHSLGLYVGLSVGWYEGLGAARRKKMFTLRSVSKYPGHDKMRQRCTHLVCTLACPSDDTRVSELQEEEENVFIEIFTGMPLLRKSVAVVHSLGLYVGLSVG